MIRFIAHFAEHIATFCQLHGIPRVEAKRILNDQDLRGLDRGATVYRLPGGQLEGDGERIAAARRIHIVSITHKQMEGQEPFPH